MCRMIAATGEIDPSALRRALQLMASNENPDHTHEKRALKEGYRHEDGWGAAWVEQGNLRVRHSIHSCLTDGSLADLDAVRTDLLVLHARRATKKNTIALENTHPFLVEHRGRPWAFCHNGALHDLHGVRPASGLVPSGTVDSELLFYHILNHLEPNDLAGSVLRSLEPFGQYTALHCLLTSADQVLAVSKRHPENAHPEYFALWEGRGPDLEVVSSEPVKGVGVDQWTRIPNPGVVTLRRKTESVTV
jgi:predicted glutamine amidotransferase